MGKMCDCEMLRCELEENHQAGSCPNPSIAKVETYGERQSLCQRCLDLCTEESHEVNPEDTRGENPSEEFSDTPRGRDALERWADRLCETDGPVSPDDY